MTKAQEETINRVVKRFETDENILALLLVGSIAHGYATELSDVDVCFVVPNDVYNERKANGQIAYYDQTDAHYEHGYVDGKFVSLEFLELLAKKGSDPARYAFKDAQILFSKIAGLEDLLAHITRYPIEEQESRTKRFHAQLEAWKWYGYEAIKHSNHYLLQRSINKMILFGGRMLLNRHQRLFPYHKWFLEELYGIKEIDGYLKEQTDKLMIEPTPENIEAYYAFIMNHHDWQVDSNNWPNHFIKDSELNWLDGDTPIEDL
jgi:predicted nucleotidyltransferase